MQTDRTNYVALLIRTINNSGQNNNVQEMPTIELYKEFLTNDFGTKRSVVQFGQMKIARLIEHYNKHFLGGLLVWTDSKSVLMSRKSTLIDVMTNNADLNNTTSLFT